MHTDGIAEGVYTSIPNMFNHFFRRNDTVLMEQEIFQKAAFFSGKGKRHSIYRGFSCSGIKGKLNEDIAGSLQNQITEVDERLAVLEHMTLKNLFTVPVAIDNAGTTLLADDLGNAIVADWKYKEE